MQGDSSRRSSQGSAARDCENLAVAAWPEVPAALRGDTASLWANAESSSPAGARDRLARLARALETDVIPRLVQAHRPGNLVTPMPAARIDDADVSAFVDHMIAGGDAEAAQILAALRERGVSVETIYLGLFSPVARHLGTLWEEDLCDFSTVTVALGRLQRLLRELSPAFGAEVEHPANGRRALFVQPRDEQHSFGLSMVAEFFRRDGWDVLGGVGGAVADPATKVRGEWVDIIGFSVGSDGRLPWLKDTIRAVRQATRNSHLVVLVGGPPFTLRPELATEVGADGTAQDGKQAPRLAEQLLGVARASK